MLLVRLIALAWLGSGPGGPRHVAAVCDAVACGPDGAALAGPAPATMPAISVITPTAMAILVVQRIRIGVPLASAHCLPVLGLPRKPSQEGY
jgi:hypothetical protein